LKTSSLIADRMKKIDSSGIRKIFDLAGSIPDPINLSIGQPDFDVPEPIKARAMRAIETGKNQYTVTQGISPLREVVLKDEKKNSGIKQESVLITSGVSGGLLLAMLALVNPGDKVAIADPYFVMYKHLCKLAGGEPLIVDTYPDFQLTARRLEDSGAGKAKLLVINSPNNPTGQVIPDEELKRIAQWADTNDIFVITDQVYSFFSYDAPAGSIARYSSNVLLLNGFSKSYAMTGWRLGYAIGPEPVIEEMTKLQQFSFVCAPSVAQEAALSANSADMDTYLKSYRAKRNLLEHGLKEHFEFETPHGAFYAFVRAPGDAGEEFVKKAIKNKCLIIPGSVFSEKSSHFRVAFAADDNTIERGTEVLNSLV